MKGQLSQATSLECGRDIGPLHASIPDFTKFLVGCGYSISSVDHRRRLITALDQWLLKHHVDLKTFDESRIEQFLRERRKQRSAQFADLPTLRCFLKYVRDTKLVSLPSIKRAKTPVDLLQARFKEYLNDERGLKQKTQDQYLVSTGDTKIPVGLFQG